MCGKERGKTCTQILSSLSNWGTLEDNGKGRMYYSEIALMKLYRIEHSPS